MLRDARSKCDDECRVDMEDEFRVIISKRCIFKLFIISLQVYTLILCMIYRYYKWMAPSGSLTKSFVSINFDEPCPI